MTLNCTDHEVVDRRNPKESKQKELKQSRDSTRILKTETSLELHHHHINMQKKRETRNVGHVGLPRGAKPHVENSVEGSSKLRKCFQRIFITVFFVSLCRHSTMQ